MAAKESLSRKLALGIGYLFTGSATSLVIAVVTLSYLSRTLGVENFGLYSALISFVGLFQFLSNLGVNRTLLKYGSTELDKVGESFGNALLLKVGLIPPLIILVLAVGFLCGYAGDNLFILLFFTLTIIFESFSSIFISIRRILGHFKLISFFKVVRTLLNLGIIILALSIDNSVYMLSLCIMIFSLVAFLCALINTILLVKPKLKLDILGEVIKDSVIFSFNDVFSKLYIRGSIVILSFFSGLHTVGIFSAAIRFTKIASLFPKQVRVAILPSIYRILESNQNNNSTDNSPSSLIENDEERSKRIFETMLKYMSMLSAPLAITIYFFSEYFILIIFGSKYSFSIPLVQLLSIFIFLRFIQTPFNLYYLGLNKHPVMVKIQGLSCLLLIIFCLLLVPQHNAYGACWAINISEFIYFLTIIIFGTRFNIWNLKEIALLTTAPLLCILVPIYVMSLFALNPIINILIVYATYTFLLFLTGQFNKKDKALFERVVLNKLIHKN